MPCASKTINYEPCDVCGVVIRYKADINRHRKLHSLELSSVTHKCPYKGCVYEGIQRSNLQTHINTHTGNKPHTCCTCDFRTADPACLVRHKKKVHGYIPRPYARDANPAPKRRRHEPPKPLTVPIPKSESENLPDICYNTKAPKNDISSISSLSSGTQLVNPQLANMAADFVNLSCSSTIPLTNPQLPNLDTEFFPNPDAPFVNCVGHGAQRLDVLDDGILRQFEALLAQYHPRPPVQFGGAPIPQPQPGVTYPAPEQFWGTYTQPTPDGLWLLPSNSEFYGQASDGCTRPEYNYNYTYSY